MTEVIDINFVKSALRPLNDNDDKFSAGTLLSICGSYGMAGAAIMSGKAALRSGLGLLRMIVPKSIYPIMATALSEAVFCPVDDNDLTNNSFIERLNNNNALLLGCGLSVSPYGKAMLDTAISKSTIPMVLDADAINIVAQNPDILKSAKAPIIMTPHIGEMSRLTGKTTDNISSDREQSALSFAKKYNVVVVLKGHITIVASPDGKVLYNKNTGNCGMATGGSGDVLAGIIASLLAQGADTLRAAGAGVFIHGTAGDIAANEYGRRSMLPTDIIEAIPKFFQKYNLT